MEMLLEYLSKGFMIMLAISMPSVLVAAGIGLVIGILQAVTQVQEQTIAAAPKILGVFLVIIIGGYGYVRLLTNLVNEGFSMAFNTVPKNDSYVLPADYYRYTRPFDGEMKDKLNNVTNVEEAMKKTGKIPYADNNQNVKYIPSKGSGGAKPNLVETKKII